MRALRFHVPLAAALMLLSPEAAWGYVGPGGGLTVIGAALALVGGVVLGVLGFVWYPLKRVFRAVSGKSPAPAEGEDA
jgi:hypothetical protein